MDNSNNKLDEFLSLITSIRTAKTTEGEEKPHKYLMLLSIISILEDNPFHDNKFTYEELEPVFNQISKKYIVNQQMLPLLEYPYYHVQSDKIWILRLKPGMENKFHEYEETRLTRKRLMETVDYASLTDDIFTVFKNTEARNVIKKRLENLLGLNVKDNVITNDFVNYLNTLSNVTANNENAITELNIQHPIFERIKVSNPITEEVWYQLQNGKHVILTGNAGDGKTMIAAEILDKFGKSSQITRKRIEVQEVDLVIVKDMSELKPEEKASLWHEMLASNKTRYLIVTNTGALLNSIQGIKLPWTKSDFLGALSAEGPHLLGDNLVIINIGRIDSIDTALEVFKKILEEGNWIQCASCKGKDKCIIHHNVKILQSNLPIVLDRLRLLYKRVYYYGNRLTMRQMTAHLAYAVTGLHSCGEMQNKLELDDKGRFFNWIFGDDGCNDIPEAQQLKGVQALKKDNIGTKTHPVLEAEIWERSELSFFDDLNTRELVVQLKSKASNNPNLSQKYRRQIRRVIYFCVPEKNSNVIKEFTTMFLESPTIKEYLDIINKGTINPAQKYELIMRVLLVLQEIFSGIRLPHRQLASLSEIFISLSVPYLITKSQYVMAKLNTDEFDLKVTEKYKAGKTSNKVIQLLYKNLKECTLDIDLPFLDFVRRRFTGEVSTQLSANYINRIAVLKNSLIKYAINVSDADVKILRIGKDRQLKLFKININDQNLEVSL